MPYLTSNEDAGHSDLYNKALAVAAILTFSAAAGQSIGKRIMKSSGKNAEKKIAEKGLSKSPSTKDVFKELYKETGIKPPSDTSLLGEISNHYNPKEAAQYVYKNNKFKRTDGNMIDRFLKNHAPTDSGPQWLRRGDANLKLMNNKVSGIKKLSDEEFKSRISQYKDFNNFLLDNNIHGVHPNEMAKAIKSVSRDPKVDADLFDSIWNKPKDALENEKSAIENLKKSSLSNEELNEITQQNAQHFIDFTNQPIRPSIFENENIPGNMPRDIMAPNNTNNKVKSVFNNPITFFNQHSKKSEGVGYDKIFDITEGRYTKPRTDLKGYDDIFNIINN